MYQTSNDLISIRSPFWSGSKLPPRTLLARAQAYLDEGLGTPESREIILGLLLANAQLREMAVLAEEIAKKTVQAPAASQ